MNRIIEKLKLHRDGFPQTFTADEVKIISDHVDILRACLFYIKNELSDVDGEIVDVYPLIDKIERVLE